MKLTCDCRTDARGVTTGALLKIGVIKMIGSKFSGGQYHKTWELQEDASLQELYDAIIRVVRDEESQFGLGNAARLILGEDGAQQLRGREGVLLQVL